MARSVNEEKKESVKQLLGEQVNRTRSVEEEQDWRPGCDPSVLSEVKDRSGPGPPVDLHVCVCVCQMLCDVIRNVNKHGVCV